MSSEHQDDSGKITEELVPEDQARREFIKRTGRFAAITPPAITFLLGTSLSSRAVAASNGSHSGYKDKRHHGEGKWRRRRRRKIKSRWHWH